MFVSAVYLNGGIGFGTADRNDFGISASPDTDGYFGREMIAFFEEFGLVLGNRDFSIGDLILFRAFFSFVTELLFPKKL